MDAAAGVVSRAPLPPPDGTRARRRPFDAVSLLSVFVVLLVLLPARLVLAPLGAAGRPALLFAGGLAIVWLLTRLLPSQVLRGFQPVRWALAVFVVAFLAAYALGYARGLPGPESRGADRALLGILSFCGVLLVALDGIATIQRLLLLLRRVVFLTGVSAGVGILQFFTGINLVDYLRVPGLSLNAPVIGIGERGGPGFARVAGLAAHYIEFGVVLAMVLPIAIHFLLFASTTSERRRAAVPVVLLAASIPLSVSRAGVLTLIVGLGLLAMAWQPWLRYRTIAAVGLGVVLFQGLVPGLLGTLRSAFVNYDVDPSIQNRQSDYAVVGAFFEDRPWFGRGPGTFLPERYILLDNQYLSTVAELGIVGGLALLVLLLTGLLTARYGRRRGGTEQHRHLNHVLSIVIVQGLVASFTFDSFAFATFTGLLFLVLGVVGALFRLRDQPETTVDVPVVLRPRRASRKVPEDVARLDPTPFLPRLLRADRERKLRRGGRTGSKAEVPIRDAMITRGHRRAPDPADIRLEAGRLQPEVSGGADMKAASIPLVGPSGDSPEGTPDQGTTRVERR